MMMGVKIPAFLIHTTEHGGLTTLSLVSDVRTYTLIGMKDIDLSGQSEAEFWGLILGTNFSVFSGFHWHSLLYN